MTQILVHDDGRWRAGTDLSAELTRAGNNTGYLWIALGEQDREQLAEIAQLLDLPPTVLAGFGPERPRLRQTRSPDMLLLAAATLSFRSQDAEVETGSWACLTTPRVVVSLESGGAGITERITADIDRPMPESSGGSYEVLHSGLRCLIEDFEAVEVGLSEAVTALEQEVFSTGQTDPVERIYLLKREVSEARRAIAPLSQALLEVADSDTITLPRRGRAGIRHPAQAALRITDQVDAFDRMLADMLSAHLTLVQIRQNADMRRISAWAAIAAVPTVIVGFYGMNFHYMPELSWPWAYPAVVAVMVIGCVVLYRLFKRSGWL